MDEQEKPDLSKLDYSKLEERIVKLGRGQLYIDGQLFAVVDSLTFALQDEVARAEEAARHVSDGMRRFADAAGAVTGTLPFDAPYWEWPRRPGKRSFLAGMRQLAEAAASDTIVMRKAQAELGEILKHHKHKPFARWDKSVQRRYNKLMKVLKEYL